MPTYGYRIFVVELYAGQKQTPIKFSETNEGHYRDVAAGLLRGMRDQTLVEERRGGHDAEPGPDGVDDVEGARDEEATDPYAGRKAMAVRLVHQQDELIYGEVLVGVFGDHETALEPPSLVEVSDDSDQGPEQGSDPDASTPPAGLDLKGRAPARRYRFVLNLPEDGKRGVLVVEDVNRSCPVDLLIRWLRQRSKAAAVPRSTAEAAGRAASAPAAWWRPRATAAVDDQQFNALLARGRLSKVELVKYRIAADGSRPTEDLRVVAPHPETRTRPEDLTALARRWYQDVQGRREARTQQTKPPRMSKDERAAAKADAEFLRQQTDREAAQEMAGLLGPEVAQIDYDDGWLVLEDDDRTKRVSPSRISELFTYVLGHDRRPSTLDFYSAARASALRLAQPLQLSLEWPKSLTLDDREVP